jgi:tetratricopeptide (TPR) repeat protein
VALQKKEDARARDCYVRAISLGSKSARLRYDYAMVLRELNAGAEAVTSALREAVALDPKMFDARYLLGYTLLKAGRYGAAIDELRAAGELAPYRAAVWEHLALACHYAGRRAEARTAAQRARKLASTPEEVDRAEGTLKLVETEPEPIARSVEKARVTQALAGPPVLRAEGLLTQVDCLGGRARLQVASGGSRLFLLVVDPAKVVLRNAGAIQTDLTCGSVAGAQRVLVEYRAAENGTYGTSGEVAAIEFR